MSCEQKRKNRTFHKPIMNFMNSKLKLRNNKGKKYSFQKNTKN